MSSGRCLFKYCGDGTYIGCSGCNVSSCCFVGPPCVEAVAGGGQLLGVGSGLPTLKYFLCNKSCCIC